MTSNIDKLNLIAPLLARRRITMKRRRPTELIFYWGLFHSLEIDDIYPDSEPTVYFRMTDVVWKRTEWPVAVSVQKTVEEYDAIVFEVAKLEIIKLEQDNYGSKDIITIDFLAELGKRTGYGDVLKFKWP